MANKKRLIDANALIEWIDMGHLRNPLETCYSERDVVDMLESRPTVDAVEVVHGRWKYYHKQNIAVCTNCSFERNLDTDFGKAISCPNCGAKMDGGNEDGC